ncbi:MAG: CrcB family protein, partial [Myxococcota bacterium]
LVSLGAVRWFGSHWPVGTLMVNIAGSLLLGVLLQLFATMDGLHPGLRLKLTTGLMGGLTTYSTFNYEILAMMESGRLPAAAVYMVLTLASCLVAGGVGMAGVRWLGPS